MMNRRAFLAAIAGAAVAPQVRIDPHYAVTSQWLDTVYPAWRAHFSQLAVMSSHRWEYDAPLDSVRMPASDIRRLAGAFADRMTALVLRDGYIGI